MTALVLDFLWLIFLPACLLDLLVSIVWTPLWPSRAWRWLRWFLRQLALWFLMRVWFPLVTRRR